MNKEHKKSGLSVRAVLLYISLCTFVIIGVTFSKYIASSTGGDSARVVEFKDISITEQGGSETQDGAREFIITPGVDIEKKATVSFDGAETAAYIFLEADVKGWQYDEGAPNTFYLLKNDENVNRISFDIAPEWTLLTFENNKYVYYMELEPNETLKDVPVIKDGVINVSPMIKNSELKGIEGNLSVTFKATAVQRNSFEESDKIEMWNSVKSK